VLILYEIIKSRDDLIAADKTETLLVFAPWSLRWHSRSFSIKSIMAAAKNDSISGGIFGPTTKNLRQAWDHRVVDKDRDIILDESKIRQLFHDIKLFPSKSQVFEMVHCAREGCTDERSDFLTFGEFCIFATELRKYYDQHNVVHLPKPLPYKNAPGRNMSIDRTASEASGGSDTNNPVVKKKSSNGCSYDVFLGGSCNPTVWRKDLAIPHFKSQGITFYNPQQSNWVPEMIELEHQAKQTSQLLFFVVNEKTRNVVSMIEISYLAGKKRKLICCLGKYPEQNHKINNDVLSKTEWLDLQGGLTVVNDLVERQGTPVFDSIEVALDCATKVIKQDISLENLGLVDGARPVQHADLQIGDRLVSLREAFNAADTGRNVKISISDLEMAFKIHVHRDLTSNDMKKISSDLKDDFIDFDTFCCIVVDFKQRKQKHSFPEEKSKHPKTGGEKRSKRKKLKSFLSKVFHRSGNSAGNSGNATADTDSSSDSAPVPVPSQLLRETPAGNSSNTGAILNRRGSSFRDVYLGGSANGSWRQDLAVPTLKKHGLTFFNPQSVTRRLMPMWAAAIENSRILLFVILGNSRSLGAMNEAAFYIGQGHNVVLVVQSIKTETEVIADSFSNSENDGGEILTKQALKDYNRGRSYLSDIANREGVPVFDNVAEAVQCVVDKCKSQN